MPEPCGCKPGGLIPTADHGKPRRWRAEWRDADGQQRYKKFLAKSIPGVEKGGKTYADAYQRSQRAAVAEGRDPFANARSRQKTAVPAVPTVAVYTETFLERHEGRVGTVETYGYRLRPHVVPVLGRRRLDTVTRGEWRDFLIALKRSGMADSTRSGVKKAVSAMLAMAVEDGYLQGNPVAGIRLPQGGKREVRLTWEHVVALADEITPRYRLLVWFGALQGLRSMEASGVRRADLETVRGQQIVEEQRRRGVGAPLKTKASTGVLPVGSYLLSEYEAHVARWDAVREGAQRRREDEVRLREKARREGRGRKPKVISSIPEEHRELVTLTRLWKPVSESSLSEEFAEAKLRCRARGVMVPEEATFRDLRHFVDAVLVAAGVEPRRVQARMRHAQLAETLDTYGYLLWETDWENAPASFQELYGIEPPAGLPASALVPHAERTRTNVVPAVKSS
ncbi:tyrosine recombinase XerC [Streptomyces spororaveus]|uniref:tyrosine recombinase XerC n=1 Tax=Streptomyces spororaveus TaxID=284039 RepID=UPI0037959AE9